jgi:hypothetical protein
MIEQGKVQVYMKGGAEFVRAVKHTWDDTTGVEMSTDLGGSSSGAKALKDCSLDQLSDMFQSALEDHETGIDVLASNDPRVQTSNCKNLSLWQTGRQQYVATPGPSITDVPELSSMHTIKTKI